jgi:hypothetical protein
MGDIPAWGWYVLSAIPVVSLGASLLLVFLDPLIAGVVSAVGILVVTPLVAVALWTWSDVGDDPMG